MAFLILVIGDLHIPDRALEIPPKVQTYESPTRVLPQTPNTAIPDDTPLCPPLAPRPAWRI